MFFLALVTVILLLVPLVWWLLTPHGENFLLYLYWVPEQGVASFSKQLKELGKTQQPCIFTPCEVFRARDDVVRVAGPAVFSRVCVRQGSWYREGKRQGQTAFMSGKRLPGRVFDEFLDAKITISNFKPDRVPEKELLSLLEEKAYTSTRPQGWENQAGYKWVKDAAMFKMLFTLTNFWGWGDNLSRWWGSHRYVHANFASQKLTTSIDGQDVAYTPVPSEAPNPNAGVCSSCVETFNLVSSDSRKLYLSCPGMCTFGAAKAGQYYDLQPFRARGEGLDW